MSAFYSFLSILLFSQVPALHCKQTQTGLKNYNSSLGLWSPRCNLFSDPLRNRNPCLGRDTYYGLNRTSRQGGMKRTARTKAAVPAGRDRVC